MIAFVVSSRRCRTSAMATVRCSAGESDSVGRSIPYVDQIAGHAPSNRRRPPLGTDAYAFVVWAAKHDSPRSSSGLASGLPVEGAVFEQLTDVEET
jgi:hypothetical protein